MTPTAAFFDDSVVIDNKFPPRRTQYAYKKNTIHLKEEHNTPTRKNTISLQEEHIKLKKNTISMQECNMYDVYLFNMLFTEFMLTRYWR